MHFIKHEFSGVRSGRWYQIDYNRYLQFTIESTETAYRFRLKKGYDLSPSGTSPRATADHVEENRGTLIAAEKVYNQYVKMYMNTHPAFVQNLDRPLPLPEAPQLQLAGGLG